MTKQIFKNTVNSIALIFLTSAMISCEENNQTKAIDSSTAITENESIPDTVVQFLISSASSDFRNHQPPTAIDFRNVKIGYLKSADKEKIFILCGEFLSQEHNEWTEFTTIKTSGYEQYLGKTQYCQDATMILTDEKLSLDLKNKYTE